MKILGLSSKERIKKSKEIQKIFKEGKAFSCNGAKCFILSNNLEYNRVGFTFKRGYGTSVQRNYSKRLSKEVYRQNKTNIKAGFDIIFLIFPGNDTFLKREKQIHVLINKAGLWLHKT